MRSLLMVCLLPVLLLGSCKKKQSDNNTTVQDFAYTVSSDSVISAYANSTTSFSFTVKVLSGDINDNHLNCTITGLPANVNVTPQTLDVSKLYGGVFTFEAGNIAVGSYPIRLSITTKAKGTEMRNLTLKITLPPDFAPNLVGTYDSCYDFCQPNSFTAKYPSVLSTVADTPFLLKITNIGELGSSFVVRAYITNVVTIPVQTVGGHTIWGNGTYTHDGRMGHTNDYLLSIGDTLVTGLDTQHCVIHLEH